MGLMTKQGYKQTEVGLIPEDWDVKKFDDFGRFFKGKGIKKDEVKFEGNPCVRYGELYTRYDNVIRETFSFISNDTAAQSIKLKSGDLLFAGSGETREDIGKSAVILREDTYAGGDIVVFRAKDIDPVFLGFISNSIPVSKQKAINGQGDAVVHIYAGGISKIQIPLPPTLTEQKAIATALSDVDALITSLEQTITKKKAIKQGAMQQLLTPPHKGGKRLPGFEGEWVEKTLGEVSHIKTGSRNNQDKVEDGEYPFYVRSQSVKRIDTYSYDEEAILIPGEGGIGTIFHYINGKFEVHQRVYKISSFSEGVLGKFIFLKMKHEFYEHAMTNSVKATVDSLRLPTFQEFEICLPPTLDEQKAIAQILSDMDAEITQLETKKEKYQAIKQGMMQELLTGKTRLI
jgi:type I restriction enzyme, S subunit